MRFKITTTNGEIVVGTIPGDDPDSFMNRVFLKPVAIFSENDADIVVAVAVAHIVTVEFE